MIRISDVRPLGSGGGVAKRVVAKPNKAQAKPQSASVDNAPAKKAFAALFTHVAQTGATSVHIEPHDGEVRVRYRVDGLLRDGEDFAGISIHAATKHIKSLANLDSDEDRVPQDGRFEAAIGDEKYVVRASLLPVADGEKIVLHFANQTNAPHDLERLGYWGHSLQAMTDAAEHTHGLILVGGPSGAGKSATLYGLLHMAAHPTRSLATVEETIEHRVPGVNQTPVNMKAGMTFASALRAVLQQDPNVLMVSDIQEPDTASATVRAALAGRLVMAGMTTHDVAATITHTTAMGVEPYLLASSLRAVANQRLVRRLCIDCREHYKPSKEEFASACEAVGLHHNGALSHMAELESTAAAELGLSVKSAAIKDGKITQLWRAKEGGCAACGGTGYKGRVAIAEVMAVSPAIQKLIFSSAAPETLYERAVSEGMMPLPLDGLVKAALGMTSVEEVLRVTSQ
jgi:type IV pilus assembly protein PilB